MAVVENLQRLKKEALTGDLLVRLGDDLLSYQIKFLNEKEQFWSHAGMIVEQGGQKLVAHISPDEGETKGVQYVAIDSFLNPAKNLSCALYRYNLSPAERDSVSSIIEAFRTSEVSFDKMYNLDTEDKMYCSELISKTLRRASNNRIGFKTINVPQAMQTAVFNHFKKELSQKTVAERKIMTIDNLYRVPDCRQVIKFTLKYLPGQ